MKQKNSCIYIPAALEETSGVSILSVVGISSVLNAGESCAAAKPSLATLENDSLSPTVGGLDDATSELPKATTAMANEFTIVWNKNGTKCHIIHCKKKGEVPQMLLWKIN